MSIARMIVWPSEERIAGWAETLSADCGLPADVARRQAGELASKLMRKPRYMRALLAAKAGEETCP